MGRKRKRSRVSIIPLDEDQENRNIQDADDSRGSLSPGGLTDQEPIRNTANARERARMQVLSKAFVRLKTTLPWVPSDTKLSKLDTLRLAASYIAHLRTVLSDDGNEVVETRERNGVVDSPSGHHEIKCQQDTCQVPPSPSPSPSPSPPSLHQPSTKTQTFTNGKLHPLKLTWPFCFTGRHTVSVPASPPRTPSPPLEPRPAATAPVSRAAPAPARLAPSTDCCGHHDPLARLADDDLVSKGWFI